MKIKLLVADDEYSGRFTLEMLLRKEMATDQNSEIDVVASLDEVVKRIKSTFYDIIFLDINFKGESSFQIVDLIPKTSKIVFVTAYAEHVIDALRKSAFDYILKPVKTEELSNCLTRFYASRDQIEPKGQIQIKEKGFTRWVQISEISHMRGQGPYAHIFVNNEQITVARTLKSLMAELGNNFIRIHKSYLVNKKFIKSFQHNQIILINQICLPISRNGLKNLDF
jgi:two-component system LytT family response regulator